MSISIFPPPRRAGSHSPAHGGPVWWSWRGRGLSRSVWNKPPADLLPLWPVWEPGWGTGRTREWSVTAEGNVSQLGLSTGVGTPQASDFVSQCLSLPICKMGLITYLTGGQESEKDEQRVTHGDRFHLHQNRIPSLGNAAQSRRPCLHLETSAKRFLFPLGERKFPGGRSPLPPPPPPPVQRSPSLPSVGRSGPCGGCGCSTSEGCTPPPTSIKSGT